jgi:DNA modification methylase
VDGPSERSAQRPQLETGYGLRDKALKPKDLVGIPWRVAFALQEDGWWLRSDIIWAKPNPMPESVTDRPTKAHEYLFLLSKSARYFYDAKAIAEPSVCADPRMVDGFVPKSDNGKHAGQPQARARRVVRYDGTQKNTGHENKPYPGANGPREIVVGDTRNARTVWSIATSPFPEAHFATFPPELPRRCILAGSAPGDTVLDPFAGAGTTLLVADRLGRNGVGIELNPTYAEMARRRIVSDAPLFSSEAP